MKSRNSHTRTLKYPKDLVREIGRGMLGKRQKRKKGQVQRRRFSNVLYKPAPTRFLRLRHKLRVLFRTSKQLPASTYARADGIRALFPLQRYSFLN